VFNISDNFGKIVVMKATIIFKILMITISVCFVSDVAIFWVVKNFARTQIWDVATPKI